MKTLETPKGYELLESKDFYAHYLSHEDRGIIGGISLLESGNLRLDLFKNGEIVAIVSKSIAAALEFANDLEAMNELGK